MQLLLTLNNQKHIFDLCVVVYFPFHIITFLITLQLFQEGHVSSVLYQVIFNVKKEKPFKIGQDRFLDNP